jgi:hypothetical protein
MLRNGVGMLAAPATGPQTNGTPGIFHRYPGSRNPVIDSWWTTSNGLSACSRRASRYAARCQALYPT